MADGGPTDKVQETLSKLTLDQHPEDAVGDKTPAVMHGVESKPKQLAADSAASSSTPAAGGGAGIYDAGKSKSSVESEETAGRAAGGAGKKPAPGIALDGLGARGKEIAIAMGMAAQEEAAAADAKHRFWATQPVRKFVEGPLDSTANGPIEHDRPVAEVKQEPYGLPAGFEWAVLDVTQPDVLTELYSLLAANYVEDDDAMFRFAYSREFLLWALTPPGYFPEWHVGVRVSKSRKLVASITGVPAELRVYGASPRRMCEINFLCVDKKLRAKRLAPVLIREVTRRVHLRGIFQAAYTAGVVLPRPVTSARYWHRSIDPKKLIDIGFSALAPRMTLSRTIRLYQLPKDPKTASIRPMTAADVPAACALLNSYLAKFSLAPVFSVEDFGHWLLPRPGVVDTFVIPGPTGGVTDLVSIYHLPSSVIGNPRYSTLNAAYLYYYAPGSLSVEALLEEALILAAQRDVDVVNCLDLMDNGPCLKNLKFAPGDGSLQYYLYNWACPQMEPPQLGLVLL